MERVNKDGVLTDENGIIFDPVFEEKIYRLGHVLSHLDLMCVKIVEDIKRITDEIMDEDEDVYDSDLAGLMGQYTAFKIAAELIDFAIRSNESFEDYVFINPDKYREELLDDLNLT